MAFMDVKISLRDAFLFHLDLMVSWTKIHFGEKLGPMKLIQEIMSDRDMELILNVELIMGLKISVHVPTIFFH